MKKIASFLGIVLILAGCSLPKGESSYPIDPEDRLRAKRGKLSGEGLTLFGGSDEDGGGSGGGAALGVNSYLWRATLDTLSFMPLASADPFGGVIITDWYEDPAAKGERFKINVLILDTNLRADAVRVSLFKQARGNNGWHDVKVDPTVVRDVENKILTRARELKISRIK